VRERTMMLAASIYLRTGMSKAFAEPTMANLRGVAQRLASATDRDDHGAVAATGRYQLALAACGLEDDQIQPMPGVTDLARIALVKGIIVIVLAPFALLGVIANFVAILLVIGVGALVKEPVSKGTARVVTGIVAFPLTWAVLFVLSDPDTAWISLLLVAIGLVALILAFAQIADLFEALSDWWALRNHVALLPDLEQLRHRASAELAGILGESDHVTGPEEAA
jgi:hypothetical protein